MSPADRDTRGDIREPEPENRLEQEVVALKAQLEARDRALRIEEAIDVVRTKALRMQKLDDIMHVLGAMSESIQGLDIGKPISFYAWIIEADDCVTQWDISGVDEEGAVANFNFTFDPTRYEQVGRHKRPWDEGRNWWLTRFDEEQLDQLIREVSNIDEVSGRLFREGVDSGYLPDYMTLSARFSRGLLGLDFTEPPGEEVAHVLTKMAGAFDLAYRRFEDLRLAERQAREAEIEAAMERIRGRALAMHSSEELFDIVVEIRRQIDSLGQLDLEACVVHFYREGEEMFESVAAVRPPGEGGEIVLANVFFPIDATDYVETMLERYASDVPEYTIELTKEMSERWQEVMLQHAPAIARRRVDFVETLRIREGSEYWNFADFSGGSLLLVTHSPATDDTKSVLRKAAHVFDLAYRRFKDLEQAEAQTREARVEAALERVRSRSMAMQSPEELVDVAHELREQLGRLGQKELETCAVHLNEEVADQVVAWWAIRRPDDDGAILTGEARFRKDACEVTREWLAGYASAASEYVIEVAGERQREWGEVLFECVPQIQSLLGAVPFPPRTYMSFADFPGGSLAAVTYEPLSVEARRLLRRAADVFALAYTRFTDLKKAQADYEALLEEKARTENALAELRTTQRRLIEQEKLASLGSLTAGIAHEIKNPLNFVNNFAEVSTELVEELSEAVAGGRTGEAQSILKEIRDNAAQIAEHGRRADSIVKAMMQHARGGTSEPEIVDLNEFLEEYINLAWHGMRARDAGFQVEVERRFDDAIGETRIQPQEMGRVVLNLLSNAFDALKGIESAQVTVSTHRSNRALEIVVEDNGPGIPEEIRSKIFEPFFTTKATGEGTGLGLSLSYDIVVRSHGGSLMVDNVPGGGARFSISLPA